MRVGIVTGRTARPIIESILSRSRLPEGVSVEIIELPVPAVGVISTKGLARIAVRSAQHALERVDIVILPGLSPGRPEEFEAVARVPAVKGPRDPGYLPHALELIARGALSPGERSSYESLGVEPVAGLPSSETAFYIDGLPVPLKGPPIVLLAELPATIPCERLESEARRVEAEGADAVIVGASRGMSTESLLKRYKAVSRSVGIPVLCETGSPGNVRALAAVGCQGYSVSAAAFPRAVERLGGDAGEAAWIVGDRDISAIARASLVARRSGVQKILLDPIVGLPLIDFSRTVERYREASTLGRPLLFSAANALGEIAADTHGAQLLLASLAAELGASAYLVVEDYWRTRHSTAEARHALDIVTSASITGSTPVNPKSRLLVIRQLQPPAGAHLSVEGARIIGRLDPIMEDKYFVVSVDHERKLIIVEYREPGRTAKWAGSEPRSLLRAVLREARVSREHAGYLGFELYNAWLALRAGKTYLQDTPVLVLPWEDSVG